MGPRLRTIRPGQPRTGGITVVRTQDVEPPNQVAPVTADIALALADIDLASADFDLAPIEVARRSAEQGRGTADMLVHRPEIGTLLASPPARLAAVWRGAVEIIFIGITISVGAAPGRRPAEQGEDRMDGKSRRKLEMGRSALEFSRAHPDTSPGYAAALARLEERLTRAEQIAAQQMEGLRDVRAAAGRKLELRRTLKHAHLAHVAQVGRAASREVPELSQKFVFRPGTTTYLAFRTAARGMAAEAQTHKEVLVKHGLADQVLDNLLQALDQFDAAVEQGVEGRQAHVGASAELRAVADEVVQVVRVMDGLNRWRFMKDAELLAAWESASNVAGPHGRSEPAEDDTPALGTPPAPGGEVRPAA